MMVLVKFEKGAVGFPHQHFNTQSTYCMGGQFEFTIGDEKKVINAGDGVYIPPCVIHVTLCLQEGILLDVFNPVREDFLYGEGASYIGKK